MLYGWGALTPTFIQRGMALLLKDIEAASKGDLDLDYIQTLPRKSILADRSKFLRSKLPMSIVSEFFIIHLSIFVSVSV